MANVSQAKLCLVFLLGSFLTALAHGQETGHGSPAPPRVALRNTEAREIRSEVNGERYEIYVKLPRGYSEGARRYPVLYVIDAETNFGGVSYIVQRLIKDGLIPEVIVVGIAYGVAYDTFYSLRIRDLTPGTDGRLVSRDARKGGAETFRTFLETELFSFIAEHYRVRGDDRALYGHSLGGLFGFDTLLARPQMFRRYILLSPSLWWDDQAIFKRIAAVRLPATPVRLYVATGEHENRKHHGGQSMVDHQLQMVALLQREKPSGLIIHSEIPEDETHRTIFGTAFTKGLRFVYAEEDEP